jgi:hypothetical protein
MPWLRAAFGLSNDTVSPSSVIWPESGLWMPDSDRTMVLLPAPLSPMRAVISPRRMVIDAPFRACTPPNDFLMSVAVRMKSPAGVVPVCGEG